MTKPSVLNRTGSSDAENKNQVASRTVSISDREPDLIGTDGGIDNLTLEEEDIVSIDQGEEFVVDGIYASLTDEEKKFTLLVLGNTVWNSDSRNLQVSARLTSF